MIKAILFFLIFALAFYFGITAVRKLTGKEALDLTKAIAYSTVCALLSVLALAAIVIAF